MNMTVGGNLLIQKTDLPYIGKDSPEAKAIKLKVGLRIYNGAPKPGKKLTATQRGEAQDRAANRAARNRAAERPG